jgi:hypothetical protein
MPNSHVEDENVIGSVPTAAESTQQPEMKKFRVPIAVNIEAHLEGDAYTYAASKDIEMEDAYSGFTMAHSELARWFGNPTEIDESGVEEGTLDEVTEHDVLQDDVKHLEAVISWDTKALAIRKAFLESLLVDNRDARWRWQLTQTKKGKTS